MNDISMTLIVSNTCSKSTMSQHEPCSHVLVNWGHSFSAESYHDVIWFSYYWVSRTNLSISSNSSKRFHLGEKNAQISWHNRELFQYNQSYSANFYLLLKINNRNKRQRSKICSKITIKKPRTMPMTSFLCFYC